MTENKIFKKILLILCFTLLKKSYLNNFNLKERKFIFLKLTNSQSSYFWKALVFNYLKTKNNFSNIEYIYQKNKNYFYEISKEKIINYFFDKKSDTYFINTEFGLIIEEDQLK